MTLVTLIGRASCYSHSIYKVNIKKSPRDDIMKVNGEFIVDLLFNSLQAFLIAILTNFKYAVCQVPFSKEIS